MTATKTTSSTKAKKLITKWLGKTAGESLLVYLRTEVDKAGNERYPDVDQKICELTPPRFLSPPPDKVPGVVWDISKVDKFVRYCRLAQHIKGAWAGLPLELELWQVVFVFGPTFGWVYEDSGLRVIRTLYQEVAKKNGKSTSAAAFGLYMMSADGESGAEVASLAGDKDRARAVFDVARAMVNGSPKLAKRLKVLRNQINREDRNSWFRVMAAGGDSKAGLNIHAAVIDELLVHKKRDLIDNIEAATAGRLQPIIAYLTTGGLDDPGSIYGEKRNYSEKVALGTIQDHTWHTAIWTVGDKDRWDDPTIWHKANPNLGISVQVNYLQNKARQATHNPAAINKFQRDHLNIRTGQFTRWLDVDQWDRSNSRWLTPDAKDLIGKPCYLGLDLASAVDLAALAILIPTEVVNPENPLEMVTLLDIIIRAWTPEATLESRAERDQAPYLQWVKEGWLTATPGNVIDYDDIEQEIKNIGSLYNVQRFHFDRWGSKQILQHITDEFGEKLVFEMNQGIASMTAPMKEIERKTLNYEIRHQANPLLRYAVQSLAVQSDPNGNIKPNRDQSTGRIDPFVASVMALDAWMRQPVFISAYEPEQRAG